MRVLVGWDDEIEAETINLILNVDEVEIEICIDPAEFEAQSTKRKWDVVLMSTNFPNEKESLDLFLKVQEANSNIPIVGVWKQGEFTNLAKFISHGLHSHLMRDSDGDYKTASTGKLRDSGSYGNVGINCRRCGASTKAVGHEAGRDQTCGDCSRGEQTCSFCSGGYEACDQARRDGTDNDRDEARRHNNDRGRQARRQ